MVFQRMITPRGRHIGERAMGDECMGKKIPFDISLFDFFCVGDLFADIEFLCTCHILSYGLSDMEID